MFKKTEDGSIINEEGKIFYFSIDRFFKDICLGDCCFICGISPKEAKFNNEHVLPNWILKKYNLHSRMINLPNLTKFRYDQYTIPCCKNCNSLMGEIIEEPIREIISKGYEHVIDHVKQKGPWLFFNWLNLLFIKTHLKDKKLRMFLDKRKDGMYISDFYEWEDLHHIHCMARSFYTNAKIDATSLGTFLGLPAKSDKSFEKFDYGDIYKSRSILIRLDDFCICSVLNDSCACRCIFEDKMKKINGFLSPIQLREILSRLAFININLKIRPRHFSKFDMKNDYVIFSEIPKYWEMKVEDESLYGKLLYNSLRGFLDKIKNENKDIIIENVKAGKYTFLFDKEGNFINKSLIPVENEQ